MKHRFSVLFHDGEYVSLRKKVDNKSVHDILITDLQMKKRRMKCDYFTEELHFNL